MIVELERCGNLAVVTIDNPPVNALTRALRSNLLDTLAAADAEEGIEAIVVRGAGRGFIAGADIRELDEGLEPPHTPEVVARIEASEKPIVAAIHGDALGGGLEIALACHGRVAATTARLGCPEVRLGLIPGATATQRLPRLVGIEGALDLMVSGRAITAPRARELGIVDALATPEGLLESAADRARALAAAGPPLPRIRDRRVEPVAAGFFEEYRRRVADRSPGQLAPDCIVRSVENAVRLPFDEGARVERELFVRCLASDQSRAMRYAFFAERAAGKLPGPVESEPRPISTVAVIGAGTMGTGIAYSLLASGYAVVLHDVNAERLAAARARIESLAAAAVAKQRVAPALGRELLARLEIAAELRAAAEADLVIEAVFEDLTLKRAVFARLDGICRDGALLATNTSTLDVDAIAESTRRPEDVLGVHFFSPANIMRLVEIVRGRRTSARAVATAVALAKSLDKLGVVVGNAYGFVGNRMFHSYGREAQLLLLEGASPEQIDGALRAWGMAMGPHAVGDLAGLDVGYRIRREHAVHADDARCFRVADALAEAGRYGQKTNLGMYRYAHGTRTPLPDPAVEEIIRREARRLGIERRAIEAREIVERCIFALIVEGIRVLEEGIARTASDIDVIWLNGYGFPRHRGGPMFHADRIGLARVQAIVEALSERLGARYWQPPSLLAELACSGRTLTGTARPAGPSA